MSKREHTKGFLTSLVKVRSHDCPNPKNGQVDIRPLSTSSFDTQHCDRDPLYIHCHLNTPLSLSLCAPKNHPLLLTCKIPIHRFHTLDGVEPHSVKHTLSSLSLSLSLPLAHMRQLFPFIPICLIHLFSLQRILRICVNQFLQHGIYVYLCLYVKVRVTKTSNYTREYKQGQDKGWGWHI